MFCKHCGKELDDSAAKCYSCGCGVNSPATNVYAILGLIFSFLGGILGFVFSLCGLSRAQKMGGEGATMAKVGFVISLVEITAEVVLVVLAIAAAALA